MPGFDGTGPAGMGPMTGGGRGSCVEPISGIGPRFFGRRLCGRGRGRRSMYSAMGLPGRARGGYPAFGTGYAPELSEEEEAELLRQELEVIQQRLAALGKAKGSKE